MGQPGEYPQAAATEEIRSFRQPHGVTIASYAALKFPTGTSLTAGWLTQYGTDNFRKKPRFNREPEPEFDVSTLLGKLTLEQTVRALFGRPPRPHQNHRHFSIVRLVAAEYRCLHTPIPETPEHASIVASCDSEDVEVHRQWWTKPGRERLDSLAEEAPSVA